MQISIKRLNTHKYEWLKKSYFYESLDSEEDIYIEYCSKYCKDIKKYLRVINLWGIYYFPKEFFSLFYEVKPLKDITELIESTNSEVYELLLETLFTDEIYDWINRSNKNVKNLLDSLEDAGYRKYPLNKGYISNVNKYTLKSGLNRNILIIRKIPGDKFFCKYNECPGHFVKNGLYIHDFFLKDFCFKESINIILKKSR